MLHHERIDPFGAFNFRVEIHGLIVGGFTNVSGLEISVEVKPVQEGGVNDMEFKIPTRTKYTDIVLQRGLTDRDMFWPWYLGVMEGIIVRKHGSIYMLNNSKEIVMGWHFFDAYPTKWVGPTFNAESSAIATESITLTHHRLIKLPI